MRIIFCSYCRLPSVNQYGSSPFDQLGQLEGCPDIYLHLQCGDSLASELSEITRLSLASPAIARYRGHYDAE